MDELALHVLGKHVLGVLDVSLAQESWCFPGEIVLVAAFTVEVELEDAWINSSDAFVVAAAPVSEHGAVRSGGAEKTIALNFIESFLTVIVLFLNDERLEIGLLGGLQVQLSLVVRLPHLVHLVVQDELLWYLDSLLFKIVLVDCSHDLGVLVADVVGVG